MEIKLLVALSCWLGCSAAISEASTKLWYSAPATTFQEGLPVGNGRLGALVFGSIEQERIDLNEDSVWSGGYQARVNANALSAFPQVVGLLNSGNISGADNLWNSKMPGTPSSERVYQPVGSVFVQFGHASEGVSGYNRSLDLETGLSVVEYVFKGTKYTRQAIASYPLGVIGFRFVANSTGALSFNITLGRDQAQHAVNVDLNRTSITMVGGATADSSLNFTSSIRVVTSTESAKSGEAERQYTDSPGSVKSNSTGLMISKSQEVFVYFDAQTAFRYPTAAEQSTIVNSKLDKAVAAGWSSLYSGAVADYQSLAGRVSLDLGNSGVAGTVETGKRIENWRSNGNITYDPELLVLTYNYGRYLLIGSSREGSLPANLQGVWNDDFNPPWGSKYTININIQMNYWAAETTNLAETHSPVFDHLRRMQTRGQYVAKTMYGASGWVCHHNTDIWGDCAPQDSNTYWSANTMGGAWLSLQLIEHYRFSKNNTFATSVALPILSDALTFFYDFLILKPDGFYATSYGASPENAYRVPANKSIPNASVGIDQGTAHDRQVLYELFKGFIELSTATGSTTGVSKAKTYLSKIKPPQIGSLGQILEWSGEYTETAPGHRHLSHLVAVHPGTQISPLLNTTLSNAALVSINRRMNNGSGNMGWSRSWAAAIYARLLKGNEAVYHICNLVSVYLSPNLFDLNDGVFQIDGNLGLVNAVTEVLLQSHAGVVHLAPALPSNVLAKGSVKGLVARGGFVVDLKWEGYRLVGATVLSKLGGTLALRVEAGTPFFVDGVAYKGPIETVMGKSYSVTV
ncbi:alpha-L-fucosidase 2 precursor protein [Rutstroemia sp. NJR-2017a WRK4]|nr:alpha-L-fucosidase 2 precursor protein [Rutstroemia sp. NJR-2017a WRK4]